MTDRRHVPEENSASSSRPRVTSTPGPSPDPVSGEFPRLRRGGLNVVSASAAPPLPAPGGSPSAPLAAPGFATSPGPSTGPLTGAAPFPVTGPVPIAAETSVGLLELTPVEPSASPTAPLRPAATAPATPAPAMTAEMASALAGLKRTRPTTTPGEPPARVPSNPGPPPPRIPTAPGPAPMSSPTEAPAAEAPARPRTVPGSAFVFEVSPGRGLTARTLAIAAAVVLGVGAVGGGVYGVAAGPGLPVPRLPETAVRCADLSARGTDLVCAATTTSLNGLLPRERRDRLAATLPVAKAAGFLRVVFEDDGRVWRIENVDGSTGSP